MQESRGKKRVREHIIADLSINHVQRLALLEGCTVQVQQADYGIDLQINTFDEEGFVEAGCIYFQLKATDSPTMVVKRQFISYNLDIRDLRLWLREVFPVILVVFDSSKAVAYWLNVRDYFRENPADPGQKTCAVRIPIANILDRGTIRGLGKRKNATINRINGGN